MSRIHYTFLLLVSLICTNSFSQHPYWDDYQTLLPEPYLNDVSRNHKVGSSVAMYNNTAVVGVPGYDSDFGCAYVYELVDGNWQIVATLKASGEPRDAEFGYSVAIDENTIVVGVPSENDYNGATYVFEKPAGGWGDAVLAARLLPGDDIPEYSWSNEFGSAVAISGNAIVVGGNQISLKEVLVYEKPANGWQDATQSLILTSSESTELFYFGSSLAINNDVIAVGSLGKAVFVYKRTDGVWPTEQSIYIREDEAYAGSSYANKIAMNNDYLVVGATKLCVYTMHNLEDYAVPAKTLSTSYFETKSISMNNDWIFTSFLHGSWENNKTIYTGSVKIYAAAGLTEPDASTSPVATFEYGTEDFGTNAQSMAVAAGNTHFLVGAPSSEQFGSKNGLAYIYDLDDVNPELSSSSFTIEPQFEMSNSGDFYGVKVVIEGDLMAVGSSGYKNKTGCVYLYERDGTGWKYMAKLTPSHQQVDAGFGESIAISGNTVAVGARNARYYVGEEILSYAGKLYFFDKQATGWADATEDGVFEGIKPYDKVGNGIYLNGDLFVIASNQDNTLKLYSGANGWNNPELVTTLKADGYNQAVEMGATMCGDDNTIIVGAPRASGSGLVYVYEKPEGGWGSKSSIDYVKLQPETYVNYGYFGDEMKLLNDALFVGYYRYDNNRCAICVFNKPSEGWQSGTEDYLIPGPEGMIDFADNFAITDHMLVATAKDATNDTRLLAFTKPEAGWEQIGEPLIMEHPNHHYNCKFGSSAAFDGDKLFLGSHLFNVTNRLMGLLTYGKPTYSVRFYDADGGLITTNETLPQRSAIAPQAPERDGYVFTGWDKAFASVSSDLDVYAQYDVASAIKSADSNAEMLYPNPASSFFTIRCGQASQMMIFNTKGGIVKQQACLAGINRIDIANLSAGIYFVKVDGAVYKLIKQ